MVLLPSHDETLDTFSSGRIQILQKKKGYRFSIDAVLLARFVRIRRGEKAIDLGTGCGILPLLLSETAKRSTFLGVEIQETLATLARRNVMLNHLEDRITILHRDFRTLPDVFPAGSFHVALSNPPYRRQLTGRTNPSQEKAIARHEIRGTLQDLVSVVSHLLPTKGRCYLIYPAPRAVDVLTELRARQLEPKRLQLVYSDPEGEAHFLLVEAVKSSGAELKILPPLVLHQEKQNQHS